ncbi:hypothetical protein V6C27_03055 [Peptococcaceae bacterium 1198_IL3148]
MACKVDEMRADIAKVKNICFRAEKVTEPRQLQQLLKQICSYTAEYMTK